MRLFLNPLQELVPEFMVANKNFTAKGAWAKNYQLAPLGCTKGNTTAVCRATTEDIATGWAGHLTERQQKELLFGVKNSASALRVETNREQLFNLQWSRCWKLRALKGWTPLASLNLEMHEHEYHFDDVDNFGAPHWWTLSQIG